MLKKYFIAGLLLWIPLSMTFWVLESIVVWSDSLVSLLPDTWQPQQWLGITFPGIGLILAAIAIFATGLVFANFLGQRLVKGWEALLQKIPLVRPIYSGVKQIAATVLSDQAQSFKEVVLIEFPQPGLWTFAFIVSTPGEDTCKACDTDDLITVYVPTAPNPTSGYVVMVSKSKVRPSSVGVDEAFKFHLSLGVMTPTKATALTENSQK